MNFIIEIIYVKNYKLIRDYILKLIGFELIVIFFILLYKQWIIRENGMVVYDSCIKQNFKMGFMIFVFDIYYFV